MSKEKKPTHCPHAYKMLDRAEDLWCDDCVEKLLQTQEPSEAEVEEFVERQIKGFKLLYLNCDDLFSRFLNNLQSWRLKRLLKEYDQLRKG